MYTTDEFTWSMGWQVSCDILIIYIYFCIYYMWNHTTHLVTKITVIFASISINNNNNKIQQTKHQNTYYKHITAYYYLGTENMGMK